MSDDPAATRSERLSLTTEIVTAQLSNNPASSAASSNRFRDADGAARREATSGFAGAGGERSIADDYTSVSRDEKKLKLLKRHLGTAYGMTPKQYRAKWGLPPGDPMVAPSYARGRQ